MSERRLADAIDGRVVVPEGQDPSGLTVIVYELNSREPLGNAVLDNSGEFKIPVDWPETSVESSVKSSADDQLFSLEIGFEIMDRHETVIHSTDDFSFEIVARKNYFTLEVNGLEEEPAHTDIVSDSSDNGTSTADPRANLKVVFSPTRPPQMQGDLASWCGKKGLDGEKLSLLVESGIDTFEKLSAISVRKTFVKTGLPTHDLANFRQMATFVMALEMDPLIAAAIVQEFEIQNFGKLASLSTDKLLAFVKQAVGKGYDIDVKAIDHSVASGWIQSASDRYCGNVTRFTNWDYLQYLIEFSKQSAEALQKIFRQQYTITRQQAANEEPTTFRKIGVEVLLGGPGSLQNPPAEYVEGQELAFIEYLLKQGNLIRDDYTAAELKQAESFIWKKFYIHALSECDFRTTRVEQCIRTLQAYLRDHPEIHDYLFEAENENLMHHDIGQIVADSSAYHQHAVANVIDRTEGRVLKGPSLDLFKLYLDDSVNYMKNVWDQDGRFEGRRVNDIVHLDVQFRLRTTDNWSGEPLCTLKVTNPKGLEPNDTNPILFSQQIHCNQATFSDTDEYQIFQFKRLIYYVERIEDLDVEIFWHGNAALYVDWIEINYKFEYREAADDSEGEFWFTAAENDFQWKESFSNLDNPDVNFDKGIVIDDEQDAEDLHALLVGGTLAGYLVRGPIRWDNPAGRPPLAKAQIDFRLASGSKPLPDDRIAILDVIKRDADHAIEQRDVTRHQIPTARHDANHVGEYFHLPISFLSEGDDYEFRVYSPGLSNLWIDRIQARFLFLYRHEWEMANERKTFPENFYRVKKSSLIGDKSALKDRITEVYLAYLEDAGQLSPTEETMAIDAYHMVLQVLDLDRELETAHEYFFAEEYGSALQGYGNVELKIREFFLAFARRRANESGVDWSQSHYLMNPRTLDDQVKQNDETFYEVLRVMDFLSTTMFPFGGLEMLPTRYVPETPSFDHLQQRINPRSLRFLANNLNLDLDHYDLFTEQVNLDDSDAEFDQPNFDSLRAILHGFGAVLVHYYYFVIPVSVGDCLSRLGRYEAADQYYRFVLSKENQPVYRFLNPNIEIPYLQIRIGQNLLAWADSLFRKNDRESKDHAVSLYSELLSDLYESKGYCHGNIYDAELQTLKESLKARGHSKNGVDQATGRSRSQDTSDDHLTRRLVEQLVQAKDNAASKDDFIEQLVRIRKQWANTSSGTAKNPIEIKRHGCIAESATGDQGMNRLQPGMDEKHSRRTAQSLKTGQSRAVQRQWRIPHRVFGVLDLGTLHPLPVICHRENPEVLRQKESACLKIGMIQKCLNVLGYGDDYLSFQRYEYLLGFARSLANTALSIEKDFIQYKTNFERETISQLSADLVVKSNHRIVQLESLRREIAASQIVQSQASLSKLQNRLDFVRWKRSVTGDVVDQYAIGATALAQVIGGAGVSIGGSGGGPSIGFSPTGLAAGVLQSTVTVAKGAKDIHHAQAELDENIFALESDVQIAELGLDIAQQQFAIADHQRDIALLKQEYDRALFEFHRFKFLNKELWNDLARAVKANYAMFVDYANVIAWMAERVLEFERNEEINIIRFDYFSTERQGLLAADNLIRDLASLDQHRLLSDKKKNPIKQIMSLATEYPLEFFQFSETGKLRFRTTLEQFERRYPGMYHGRIKNIEIVVQGLIGPDGIQAKLSNLGTSLIRVVNQRDEANSVETLSHPGESFMLSSFAKRGDEVLFQPSSVNKEMNIFEGVGLGSEWEFEMDIDSNDINFDSIVDVKMIVYFTGHHSKSFEDEQRDDSPKSFGRIRPYSMKHHFPDSFYHLLNQVNGVNERDLRLVKFTTRETDFPANENNRRIRNIHVFVKTADDAPSQQLAFSLASQGQLTPVRRTATTIVSNDNVLASTLAQWDGRPIDDTWSVKLVAELNDQWHSKNLVGAAVETPENSVLRVAKSASDPLPSDLPLVALDGISGFHMQFKSRFHNGSLKVSFFDSQNSSLRREVNLLRQFAELDQPISSTDSNLLVPDFDWYEIELQTFAAADANGNANIHLKVSIDGLIRLDTVLANTSVTDRVSLGIAADVSSDCRIEIDDLVIHRMNESGFKTNSVMRERFQSGTFPPPATQLPAGWQVAEPAPMHPQADYSAIDDILFSIEYDYTPANVLLYEPVTRDDEAYYRELGWLPALEWSLALNHEKPRLRCQGDSSIIYRQGETIPKWRDYRLVVDARIKAGGLRLGCLAGIEGWVRLRVFHNFFQVNVRSIRDDIAHSFQTPLMYITGIDLASGMHKFELEFVAGRCRVWIDGIKVFNKLIHQYPKYGTIEIGAEDGGAIEVDLVCVEKIND